MTRPFKNGDKVKILNIASEHYEKKAIFLRFFTPFPFASYRRCELLVEENGKFVKREDFRLEEIELLGDK